MSFIGAMRRAEADFYVLKTPWHLLPMMVLFGRCYRKKIVFWGQTTPAASGRQAARGGWFQRLESWSVKRADLVMAQTREQGDYFAQDYGVQASVIPSICDALIPDWQCKVTGSRCKSVDVLWVGNQLPNKRQEVVLELARQTPEYQYALALKITDRARFEQTRKAAEAVPNLLMLGEVAHVEMEKWFKQTRVFLSTSGREGFPNTFLQAWMNGVPVVSLGVDPDGLIQERLLGRVAYPGCATEPAADPVKLAASLVGILREILENEQLRLTMGENGRRYVKDNHAPERVVPALVEALARVQ
jgi:glycosyltransferase involved in cell wall biosynthesis